MSQAPQVCPVTGSSVTALPPSHPDTQGSDKPCPVTNATTTNHQNVVHAHPSISASATEKDCPVLQRAAQEKTCPVVGSSATALPPSHPTTMSGDVCPRTNAKLSDHKTVVSGHPIISANASIQDCPAMSSASSKSPATQNGSIKTDQCPVSGSKVSALPPDHPPTSAGEVCPVTKATTTHHEGIVKEHPPVSADASAKDCPVMQQAAESKICPVVGSATSTLPPAHPAFEKGAKCPVTAATAEHHGDFAPHPSVQNADGGAKCPVTGAVAEHHKSAVDPETANTTMAQCPVTGQFADGSRPAVQVPAELAAEPIKFTLMGIPFSTFTRTVAMGLHELQIPFTQIPVPPHSKEILEYNPFGRLPVLLIEHSGKRMPMYESDSIIRYLDSAEDRLLRFSAKDLIRNQMVEEWIGIISNYVFDVVEKGVVKPYLADNKADLEEGVKEMNKILAIVEKKMQGPYLLGFNTTWSDLFLYPILADLAATPYGKELEQYQKLNPWTKRMQKRSTAKLTVDGTLEGGASPP